MIKSTKEFFSKFIFSIVFVYILCLGIFNILIMFNKSKIELFLADILEAKTVTIGHISNLPLVFISGTEFSIDVDEKLSFKIEGFYIHYRFFKLFTKEYAQFIKEIEVDNVVFNGHVKEISNYQEKLTKKFSQLSFKSDVSIDFNTLISKISAILKIRQVALTFNVMQEFWHKITFNNINVNLNHNQVKWFSKIYATSIWSNQVFIAETSLTTEGVLNNLSNIHNTNTQVSLDLNISSMNLAGIPIIKSNMIFHAAYSNNQYNFNLVDVYKINNIKLQTDKNKIAFSLKNSFNIAYNAYEEYQLLDYVFKPGLWNLSIDLTKKNDWDLDIQLFSSQYQDYGLKISLDPIKKNSLYSILVDLKTHYFGSVRGDLILPIRKGLYPLPSGSLYLDDVRFILNGLIFSGNVIADVVHNKNEIELSAFDVKMNGGYIGNTSIRMEFTTNGVFNIYPRTMKNSSVDVFASIGDRVFVELKALDVDGDFVAQNIKIPIFGIKESRYKGLITMHKESLLDPFILNGYLKGYLDEEEQIDAVVSLKDTLIKIPRFYLVNQDILLDGQVLISPYYSNIVISIDAQGLYKNNTIPIDITVDIKKDDVIVSGLVDDTIKITTYTQGDLTKFNIDFTNYPMNKLGLPGIVDGSFIMNFTGFQTSRFAIQEGKWKINNREFTLDFDALQDIDTNLLNTSYMKLGLDGDILDGYGYFSFTNNQFLGSFRFDRGGSFQFNIGRYIVKSHINIQKLEIENILSSKQFDFLSFLRTEETEVILASLDASIVGTGSDFVYKGSLDIEGKEFEKFRFIIPKFVVSNNFVALTNVRLRHSLFNVDTDTLFYYDDQNFQIKSQGSLALESIVKSDFSIDYNTKNNHGILKYNLPNLYFLSTKPISLEGQIVHDKNNYLFLSENVRNGFVGYYSVDNNNLNWDISLLHNSMRFISEGKIIDRNIYSSIDWDVFLNKLSLSGDFKKVSGNLRFNSIINGSIDNPIVNGELVGTNIELSLRSLRNRLQIENQQKIYISNNQIIIPDITINAVGGGEFGLTGSVSIQDQAIGNTDIKLYSKNDIVNKTSFLNWNLEVPYLFVKGKTYINDITINGDINKLLLSSYIDTENLNIGLELDDTLVSSTPSSLPTKNPFVGILSLMDLDININLKNKSRFLNQLFDVEFEQQQPVKISGNLGDGSINVEGDFNISKGKIAYLNTDLTVNSGMIQFSGDQNDFIPYIYLQTEIKRSIQNELVDIEVNFSGKLPNLELSKITSIPTKSRSELLNVLGFGGSYNLNNSSINSAQNTTSAQDLIASSVGVAENALFTAPLSRKIQQLVPFIDTFQIKTDVLGNLTRSVNASGNAVTGLSILHGSELEVGQYLPNISGLQIKYNLRLESPDNSSLDSGSLNQIHKAGVEWSRMLPYTWRLGVGANVLGEVKPNEQQSSQPEFIFESSLKKRF